MVSCTFFQAVDPRNLGEGGEDLLEVEDGSGTQ